MSGKTENLILVEPLSRHGRSLGFVGRVKSVNPGPITEALESGRVPVISPISAHESGESYNVNADNAAAALSRYTGCSDLVFFTDVKGVLTENSIIPSLSFARAEKLIKEGVIKEGMVAKMESAFEALSGDVKRVHICRWQEGVLESIVEEETRFGTTVHL
jgi:acetylglutamate kinase